MNGWANKYLSNISFLFFSFFFSSIKRFFLHYFPRCKFTGGNSFEEIVIVSRKLIPIPFPSPLKSFGFNVFVDILIGEITLRPVTLSYNFNDNFNWRKSRRINFHASRNISRVGSPPESNPAENRALETLILFQGGAHLADSISTTSFAGEDLVVCLSRSWESATRPACHTFRPHWSKIGKGKGSIFGSSNLFPMREAMREWNTKGKKILEQRCWSPIVQIKGG